ncbi:hypothetical protein [Saccharothrix xinjiangensis]|uniref:Uncharacterized protein n=1 Tax=Saccharothrix xinjiangensis TaxID=204798 RepID=A0ABV9YD88_9PSEU
MARPDHPDRRPSRRHADADHPTAARPGGRRSGDRRPWPTAPTTTRVSPGKPTAGAAHPRSRGSSSTPTPATVWTAGSHPIDLDATWPTALVERIVTSFSRPAAQVVLLTWPTPGGDRPTAASAGLDGILAHPSGTGTDTGLTHAVHAVERLDRAARVEHVPVETPATDPVRRPADSDLAADSDPAHASGPTVPACVVEPGSHHQRSTSSGGADLVVANLRPQHSGTRGADLAALSAARLLRVGGILVVLTHCDWTAGELTDPTGAVVTAGQNADLLYLQHIVAVHAPVRDGRFHLADLHPNTEDAQDYARHRAPVRGLPAPHRRIHSDVLVFAQPHDHQPPPSARVDGPSRDGDLR